MIKNRWNTTLEGRVELQGAKEALKSCWAAVGLFTRREELDVVNALLTAICDKAELSVGPSDQHCRLYQTATEIARPESVNSVSRILFAASFRGSKIIDGRYLCCSKQVMKSLLEFMRGTNSFLYVQNIRLRTLEDMITFVVSLHMRVPLKQ